MLIDWFTVGAQAINFLILVWLLKRFLYGPVLAAIDAREKKVAAKLVDAAAREAQAQRERDDFRRRNEALDHERAGLLRKATDEAALERQRLIESAREDSQLLRARLTEALAKERAELDRQLLTRTQAEVLALARGTLTELAGVDLEERMTEVFVARLRELPQERRRLLSDGLTQSRQSTVADAALVRSAFELPSSKRPGIEAAIRECLGANVTIRFEASPNLVCGVELRVGGVKLAWSVTDYLSSISEKIATLAVPAAGMATASALAPGLESPPAPAAAAAPPAMESQHGR